MDEFPHDKSIQNLSKEFIKQGKLYTNQFIEQYCSQSSESTVHEKFCDPLLAPKIAQYEFQEISEFDCSKSNLTGDDFWALNGSSFKQMHKLYKRFRPIQFSNASIERLFSEAGLVFDKSCGKMDAKCMQRLGTIWVFCH